MASYIPSYIFQFTPDNWHNYTDDSSALKQNKSGFLQAPLGGACEFILIPVEAVKISMQCVLPAVIVIGSSFL